MQLHQGQAKQTIAQKKDDDAHESFKEDGQAKVLSKMIEVDEKQISQLQSKQGLLVQKQKQLEKDMEQQEANKREQRELLKKQKAEQRAARRTAFVTRIQETEKLTQNDENNDIEIMKAKHTVELEKKRLQLMQAGKEEQSKIKRSIKEMESKFKKQV